MTKVSRVQKKKRLSTYRKTRGYTQTFITCLNCKEPGSHFVPPSFSDPGFYTCVKKEA